MSHASTEAIAALQCAEARVMEVCGEIQIVNKDVLRKTLGRSPGKGA
jgi:hypothetical protein